MGNRKGSAMKAFIYQRYGPPETLRMADVDIPAPNADEVLVQVRAASVNAADWHVMRGKPLFSRATLGLLRPKHQILGVDVAGQVEAVGSGVTASSRATRSTPTSWTTATVALPRTSRCRWRLPR
jgi:NADPH:quinone reductase-like Zn-dependent oxidoreductase